MKIRINIKVIESSTFVLNEDGGFDCRHNFATVEPPCCTSAGSNGVIECGCGGSYLVACPDCELTDSQAEALLEAKCEASGRV